MSERARDLLERLPLFAGLGEPSLTALSKRTIERTVARGSFLFREGEPCHGLYVVARGRIKIYRASPDGREQVLQARARGNQAS